MNPPPGRPKEGSLPLGGTARSAQGAFSFPLQGLTIIDMTRLLPGPAATMHLVDFGADVIKVEDTGAGDYMRSFPPTVALSGGKTVNAAFEAVNRGKRSIAIDLKSDEGREVLLRLVDRADALIEGFRPGVLERLSLGWEALHARNPRLVLCSLSGYGQNGPLSQRAGHDLNYIAMTGVLDQIRASGKLAIPNLQIGDLLGGTLSALATMLIAMLGAQRSGEGVHVDVAMTDGLLAHHLFPHAAVDSGVDPVAESTLLTGGVACYQIYKTHDRHHLALGALELKFWQAFCEAAGLSELKSRHWELGEAPGSPSAIATIELVAQRIAEHPIKYWLQVFEPVDACVTPVLTPAEALAHPHHLARNLVHNERGVSEIGPLAQMALPHWNSRPAPGHGEHTSALLSEIGYSALDAQRMAAAGVVK
jgi:alpha-methylacyl-CoA racemase